MKPRIGFIGIGIMGRHMSRHLMSAGYELVAFDVYKPSLEAVVADGAQEGTSAADVAARSDVVITMLPDSPDVEKVALGEGGIIESAREGLIFIDMSTIAPGMAIKVAETLGELGVRCLDAPVSGGEVGAAESGPIDYGRRPQRPVRGSPAHPQDHGRNRDPVRRKRRRTDG